jgi:hypothetical protein
MSVKEQRLWLLGLFYILLPDPSLLKVLTFVMLLLLLSKLIIDLR